MAKTNQISESANKEAVEQIMSDSLAKGEHVIIPDFGHLEVRLLQDRRTVFFKQSENEDSFLQIMSPSKGDKENTNAFFTAISAPLKEGVIVNLPKIGVFRPIQQEDGKIRVSFIPSSSLRKLLNRDGEVVPESKEETLTETETKVEKIITKEKEERIQLSSSREILDKINKDEKIVNSEVSAVNENGINEEKEFVRKDESRINIPKQPLPMTSRTARVGDVIVPQDDLVIKSKSKGISGWMVGFVAAVAVLIVVVITLLSGSNKKTEDEMVLSIPTKSINLPSMAEKHYGNAAFWIYIYEANYDKLSSPVNIPSNVSLLIPDLKNEYNIDVTDSMEIKRANILSEMLLKKNNSK